MKFNTDKIIWTDSMKEFAKDQTERKLTRIISDPSSIEFKLTKINGEEIKVTAAVDNYRAQAINEDFYIAISEALGKVKQIIVKAVKKINDRDNIYKRIEETTDDTVDALVSKEKLFFLEPMTLERAIDEFEKTDYTFYVFKDIDYENNVSIIYKRFDKKYGIIRCK